MSDYFVDTSYARKYVVVSATDGHVVLRPVEDETLNSYWCEFISGYIDGPVQPDLIPTIHLTQLPAEVLTIDAYVDYTLEYPRVEVNYGGRVIDVSDNVSVNHPNPETPGLYALDYMLSLGGGKATPIWRSWLSIEEVPLLRRVITPWNRENKTIANINRLIIEPQVTEALYEAGVPLYNFQQANTNVAVGQFASQRYKGARAFVKDNRLFISGPCLPIGTDVRMGEYTSILGASVMCLQFNRDDTYVHGDIVSYCGSDYYALQDIPKVTLSEGTDTTNPIVGSLLPTSCDVGDGSTSQYWLKGTYYIVDSLGAHDGEIPLSAIWAAVDVNGYLFKMDLLRALPLHHYWGHYNRKNFYDYAYGDLVSVVSDNVISLYQRNETPIDDVDIEEAYRPGHYRNSHWVEVYSESNDTLLHNPIIKPYTNAMNSVVSKTYPVREEAFRMYANMVGMPMELVSALGAKYSVLLWALLYRTRETFPGIKAALNAIGMDITNLHRVYPSLVYTQYDKNGAAKEITGIYQEIDKVREIAKSVAADRVWTKDRGTDVLENDELDTEQVRWISYADDGNTVLEYDAKSKDWVPFYTFHLVGSDLNPGTYDYSTNNRYYKADINLMSRLQSECGVDLGDGYERIAHNYFVQLSAAMSQLLNYEIPIYVYFRLKISLAAVGHTSLRGASKGALYMDAWCESVGLKVFPGKLFDFATCTTIQYYPKVLYAYEYPGEDSTDSEWTEKLPNYRAVEGYQYYAFDQSVYIRMVYPEDSGGSLYKVSSIWTSRFTLGCLGDKDSVGTGDYKVLPDGSTEGFRDATLMTQPDDPTHSGDLYLCKGLVGCTLKISTSTLEVDAYCLKWNYIFGDPSWTMDEVKPFADWYKVEGTKFQGCWAGSAQEFKQTIVKCTSPTMSGITCTWGDEETPTLYVDGGMPDKLVLWDWKGNVRGTVTIPYSSDMVLGQHGSEYTLKLEFHM